MEADKNGDGMVSEEEFSLAMTEMIKRSRVFMKQMERHTYMPP